MPKTVAPDGAKPRPTPPQRRTQAQRRDETRSRILVAAVNELTSKGYAGFRVNEVAIAAGVSKGAQTHHFPTKQSLVIAAVRRAYEDSHAGSMRLVGAIRPGSDVFAALVKDSEQFYLGPTFAISITMMGLGDYEPELRRQVQLVSRRFRLPIEGEWLRALCASGMPEDTARTVLYLTHNIYRGIVIRRLMRHEPKYARYSTSAWARLARGLIESGLGKVATPA
ncbi:MULTISPECIES: TetR/AcrR family transcriptional regulator [unclassified Luteimonas]|uniref:TetR/AcrR family transcriptional regulator n=1 Tax=unclassified Luteimonas TaxID=2629088 RepID=UPI0016019180|nr:MULTISPECIES: TetR/AcrR family transcriptional regulator [unclassified Luteimonas]MBB1473310.1 TetR/AcrR family transcriptional regulator [Luteimonas sp. MC1782]MBB6600516.1 TetR/AcrR family transcriptional regulator [Luteimonas sp. MC1825]QOC88175.1 TetR/AcrR family transcriptional regulator [Luteimonas sp. MC1825]